MTEVIHLDASASAETRNGLATEINLLCSKCYSVSSAVTWHVINGRGSLRVYWIRSLVSFHCNIDRCVRTIEIASHAFIGRFSGGILVLANQNSVQEEIKSGLKSGNASYFSVQDLLSSSLQSKNLNIKIYRTINLPVVLCGFETWSLTLREESWLRVFENRVLRRIFGPKMDKVTGECREQHNELNDLYSLPNIVRVIKSRRMRWAGHVARMVEGRGVYRVLMGKREGRRPLGRPRHRWEDNIKIDLQ